MDLMASMIIEPVRARLMGRLSPSGNLPYPADRDAKTALALEAWIMENNVRMESYPQNKLQEFLRGTCISRSKREAIWQSLALNELEHMTLWRRWLRNSILVGLPGSSIRDDSEGLTLMRSIRDVCVSVCRDTSEYGWGVSRAAFVEFRRISDVGHGRYCDCNEESK